MERPLIAFLLLVALIFSCVCLSSAMSTPGMNLWATMTVGADSQGRTQTVDVARAGLTQTVEAAAIRATVEAREAATVVALNLQSIQAEGTVQAKAQEMQAAQQTADGYRAALTATAVERAAEGTRMAAQQTQAAWETAQEMTRSAASTAEARIWLVQGWTATADSARATDQAGATVTARSVTATAEAIGGTATQGAQNITLTAVVAQGNALATIQAAEAESMLLALERERTMNQVQAAAPWVAAGLAMVLGAVLAWRFAGVEILRRRAFYRDARGDAPIMLLEDQYGRQVIDADRTPGPALTIQEGQVNAPMASDPATLAAVLRDQAIDFRSRGLPGSVQRVGQKVLENAQPKALEADIEVVEAENVREILDEVETKLLMEGGK